MRPPSGVQAIALASGVWAAPMEPEGPSLPPSQHPNAAAPISRSSSAVKPTSDGSTFRTPLRRRLPHRHARRRRPDPPANAPLLVRRPDAPWATSARRPRVRSDHADSARVAAMEELPRCHGRPARRRRLAAYPDGYEDYLALGETKHHEYYDGLCVVNPPSRGHSRTQAHLVDLLRLHCPDSHEVLTGLGMARRPGTRPRARHHGDRPVLTRRRRAPPAAPVARGGDLVTIHPRRRLGKKRQSYAAGGASWYWVVDIPSRVTVVLENIDGEFVEVQPSRHPPSPPALPSSSTREAEGTRVECGYGRASDPAGDWFEVARSQDVGFEAGRCGRPLPAISSATGVGQGRCTWSTAGVPTWG